MIFFPNAIKLRQNALLHFCRSFIGEGYGKYLPIGAGIKDQKFDVFHSQREGFPEPAEALYTNSSMWICSFEV